MTLPSPAHTGNKTSTLRGHVLPCLKLFLGSCRPWHEVQLCLSLGFCRLPPPPPLPSSSQPCSGTCRLFWASLPSHNFLSLQCLPTSLSGRAIYSSGPVILASLCRKPGLQSNSLPVVPCLPPPTKCLPKTLAEGCGGTGGEPHLGSSPCVCAQVQP